MGCPISISFPSEAECNAAGEQCTYNCVGSLCECQTSPKWIGIWVGISIAITLVITLLAFLYIWCARKRREDHNNRNTHHENNKIEMNHHHGDNPLSISHH